MPLMYLLRVTRSHLLAVECWMSNSLPSGYLKLIHLRRHGADMVWGSRVILIYYYNHKISFQTCNIPPGEAVSPISSKWPLTRTNKIMHMVTTHDNIVKNVHSELVVRWCQISRPRRTGTLLVLRYDICNDILCHKYTIRTPSPWWLKLRSVFEISTAS